MWWKGNPAELTFPQVLPGNYYRQLFIPLQKLIKRLSLCGRYIVPDSYFPRKYGVK